MKHVAVIGLGKVGSLVGTLLSDIFTVTGFDQSKPAAEVPFEITTGSIRDTAALETFLSGQDAVVSCLPYNLNLPVAQAAHKLGIHYFDLTEDVPTTAAIREMAKTSKGAMAPQCGLAPGFIGIVGADLYKRFSRLRDVELRVGALPRYPNGLMGYSFTWSPAGVINEYINDAEVIHNGERKMVPSLEGIEMINIEGQEFEAFSTSGGLGTMCETLAGKVDTLNYKTMRYPGHARLMRFLLYELILKEKRELVEQILTEAKPPVREDVVYVYAVVEGWKGDQLAREEFYHAYHPILIGGKEWRAISWTTAASVAAVVEMVANGTLPQQGFIKQEEISFESFLETKNGKLYSNHQ
ncbi:saccharopine dehydrogenase family protein [Flavihumibacter solisilvae]|jgi:saccharopine dehydrogenase-like NADP-dependent oxidoreductase|uniref:L-lysine dehydrogenase n=1 Tax=Flavihumibacter solisilvae TaxID=1349421 RepID=A0A0C1LHQ4_9BACT|nr:saccharopine dehydrogenase C-terminal domain-containing protein [Flavihumibacter solisilvae]KIC94903.1 L-lysine dehydrogenase [Flavihumibacter solisilvae]